MFVSYGFNFSQLMFVRFWEMSMFERSGNALVNVDPMLNCLSRVCVYDYQKYLGFTCKEVM